MLAPGLVHALHCGLDASVALSGVGIGVLSVMEQREGGPEDPLDPLLPCGHPREVRKGAHVPSFHVVTSSCCLLRSRMSLQYVTPVLMVNVTGSMVGPVRIAGMGIGNLSCVGQGDPGSDHGEMGLTLVIYKWSSGG